MIHLPDRIHYDGDWNYYLDWFFGVVTFSSRPYPLWWGLKHTDYFKAPKVIASRPYPLWWGLKLFRMFSLQVRPILPDRIHYDGDWNMLELSYIFTHRILPDRIHYDGDWNLPGTFHILWVSSFQTVSTMMGIETRRKCRRHYFHFLLPDRIHYDGDWNPD